MQTDKKISLWATIFLGVLVLIFLGYKLWNFSTTKTNEQAAKESSLVDSETKTLLDNEGIKETKMVTLKTSLGNIKIELYPDKAPKTVENFVKLTSADFYNGTLFHRVIKDFMIQGGDPNSKNKDWSTHGQGGPGYNFEDEFNDIKLIEGVLAMANSGPNTNGSQFFIVTAKETPWLDGKHTAFGRVIEGMDIVKKIENVEVDPSRGDHPIDDVKILGTEVK